MHWTPEEISELINMCRQGHPMKEIAEVLDKTERAVAQKYVKLVPPANSHNKKKVGQIVVTEEVKVKLLSAVARGKTPFWNTVAKEVGSGISGAQCEEEYNEVIRKR